MASIEAELRSENERLRAALADMARERDEGLQREETSADILRSIASSSQTLADFLLALITTAIRLAGAQAGNVWLREGDGMRLIVGQIPAATGLSIGDVYPIESSRMAAAVAIRTGQFAAYDFLTLPQQATSQERTYFSRTGFRHVAALPLKRHGDAVGAIMLFRAGAGAAPFSDRHVALLAAFADQAVIAIENARLFNELEERNRDLAESLEQQTATAAVLRIISSAPTDHIRVFDALATSAQRLCAASDIHISLVEADQFVLKACAGTAWGQLLLGSGLPLTSTRVASQALLRKTEIHVLDVQQESERYADSAESARQLGHHSMLAVPMLQVGHAVGVICVARTEVLPFSQQQIALLRSFADQAVIAIENARLFNELQQRNAELGAALGRQTAMSEVLQLISRSPTDVQPVFDAIVERSARLCGATGCRLWLAEDDTFRWVALWGQRTIDSKDEPAPVTANAERARAFRAMRETVQFRGSGSGNVIVERGQIEVDPARFRQRAPAYELGMRAALFVPLRRDDSTIGMLTLSLTEERSFKAEEVALVEIFADQAVIAIENARLFNELEERNCDLAESLEQQTATSEILSIISRSSFDPQTVLDAVVTRAALLAAGDNAYVALLDGEALAIVADWDNGIRQTSGRLATPRNAGMAQLKGNNLHEAILTGRTIALHGGPEGIAEAYPGTAAIWRRNGIGSAVIVPLAEGERTLGALAVRRVSPAAFTPRQITLLESFANQAVVAMENARLFGEIQDKTRELEAVNHRLEEANAAKSQFLSTMSHELRTPLNAVIGYSELLREEAEDEGLKGMVPDLVRINAAGKHLLSLINNVLDISKIEAGKMELELQDFAVSDLLAEVEAVVPPLMSRNSNRFVLEVQENLGGAHTDETKLRQCLLNLLSNAAKFTDRGTVSLSVQRSVDSAGDRLTFAVTDTGIGIPPEQQGRLFQSFTQAEADTSSRYGGTGLGLSLSREFARLMGGDITVESEPGKGSTFTLAVPVMSVTAG